MVVPDDDDATLYVAAGRGDEGAFARLFDRHQASVVRFCFRFVGDLPRAEELAQDIFVRLYQSAPRWRPEARFQTYLFRVATNRCLNERRREKARPEVSDAQVRDDGEAGPTDSAADAHTPHDALVGRELEAVVRAALGAMSDRERAAFAMCRFEGLAYKDIAHALEASEAAVKSLIHRATLTVARHLEAWRQQTRPARSTA